jgi:hypothetical protein
MAFVVADRVKETSTTTGTGAIALAGAVAGFQSFASGVGNSNTTYYAVVNQAATEWEVGFGTLDSTSANLARTTVLASSNGGSLVAFTAGTKEVFVTQPATRTLVQASGGGTTNGVLFYTGSGIAAATGALTFNGTDFATAGASTAGSFSTAGASTAGSFSTAGTSTAGSFSTAGTVTATGTATAGSFSTAGTVTATGTATAASLIPTSSTAPTNGVYLPAANTVGFATNSTGVVYINASGNLLVGTPTSGKRLTVSDSIESTATFIRTSNTVGNENLIDFQLQNSSSAAVIYSQIGSSIITNTAGAVNGAFVINTTNASVSAERVRVDNAGNMQMPTGALMPYTPNPGSISSATTLTNAQLQTQLINTTGTSFTLTMPLGTTLETLANWAGVDVGYDFIIINTASGTITMALNTGVTSIGTLTILTGISARFRIRRTGANAFVFYRIG